MRAARLCAVLTAKTCEQRWPRHANQCKVAEVWTPQAYGEAPATEPGDKHDEEDDHDRADRDAEDPVADERGHDRDDDEREESDHRW